MRRSAVAPLSLVLAHALLSASCSSSPHPSQPLQPTAITAPSPTVRPGDTLPLDVSSVVSIDGVYPLPAGRYRMAMACWGSVDFSLSDSNIYASRELSGGCTSGGGAGGVNTGPREIQGPGTLTVRFYTDLSFLTINLAPLP